MTKPKQSETELTSASRRKAVKQIVSGISALAAYNMLPVRWEKPIIEQVFLPAHAQTSGEVVTCEGCSLEDPCTVTILDGHQFSDNVVVQVDGYVTPPTAGLSVSIELTPLNVSKAPLETTATYQTTTDSEGKYTGIYTIAGGPGIEEVSAVTTVLGADGQARCSASSHVEPPQGEENPCVTVTFIHAPIYFRDGGVRLDDGTDCAGDNIDVRIYHDATAGPTSISIPFDRVNPEVRSRVGRNNVVAELVYSNGTTSTVNCWRRTTLSLTDVVTVTFTPAAAVP